MINDQTYQVEEAKINDLFKQAGWKVELQANYERIERIADRAMFENITKDTTIIFEGEEAKVAGVGPVTTKLMTKDGGFIMVPNDDLLGTTTRGRSAE